MTQDGLVVAAAPLRPALDAAWRRYRDVVLRPWRGKGKGPVQEQAARDLIDAAGSPEELDAIAVRATGFDGAGEAVALCMTMQTDLVTPFVQRHLDDLAVLEWAVLHRRMIAGLYSCGLFTRFATEDAIYQDPDTGALIHVALRSSSAEVWRALADELLAEAEFLLLDFVCAGPDCAGRRGVEFGAWRAAQLAVLLRHAPAGVPTDLSWRRIDALRVLIASWLRYTDAGAPGPFEDWFHAEENGRREPHSPTTSLPDPARGEAASPCQQE
ncbi:hypothetical protein [Actinomycetospora soli]|uniref:hypothetical protein n=1 Tax=Actinomycetospora soli TaxID=2893887 RepID=UPI001E2BB889|nr:hypothetical protein [Actinomycetospora soli]MCD2191244.1 hypothetical protein [Actinomycetospora soli]